jgi:hypothetical protein
MTVRSCALRHNSEIRRRRARDAAWWLGVRFSYWLLLGGGGARLALLFDAVNVAPRHIPPWAASWLSFREAMLRSLPRQRLAQRVLRGRLGVVSNLPCLPPQLPPLPRHPSLLVGGDVRCHTCARPSFESFSYLASGRRPLLGVP